jgi:hypothetical protein
MKICKNLSGYLERDSLSVYQSEKYFEERCREI